MNIVVIGGGTAGTLSALFCQRSFPQYNIYLVDSSSLGPIGVGESTTPPLVELLNYLDISLADMVNNCGATIKNATRFTNWNGDDDIYHHGFNTIPELDIFYNSNKSYFTNHSIVWPAHKSFLAIEELSKNNTLDDIHFSGILSKKNKVPWAEEHGYLQDYATIGLHFDASKAAKYFKDVAISRSVKCIDAKLVESRLNEKGFVQDILLDNNETIKTDFIFDCTGFSRLFVEKTYSSSFKSFKDYLPVNEAIPFFLPREEKDTPTYTEAIAMNSGWMWKTPVEGRFGCGYVYDNSYINKDEAILELTNMLGIEPKINKCINFESGYFETPWNKNTLAVGLSSGFLEPLEATSIWITVISLHLVLEHMPGLIEKDENAINEYNKSFTRSINSILALVQFHYLSKRRDTPFWKEFLDKNKICPALKDILNIYKYRLPSNLESYQYNSFPPLSWLLVGAGIKYFEKDIVNKEQRSYNIKSNLSNQFKNTANIIADKCLDHDDYLKLLRNQK